MRNLPLFVVCTLALGLASPVFAEKAPPKLKMIGVMQAELGEELSAETWKALKAADRCANSDKTWLNAMRSEQQTGLDSLYEMMAAPVTCWQNAEKKAGKAGEQMGAVGVYVTAQKHYVQTMRAYVWALQAKALGDQLSGCKRFRLAIKESADSVSASEGLLDLFSSVESKTIAGQLTQNILGMGTTITDTYASVKCD
jgi:hypothetical protein